MESYARIDTEDGQTIIVQGIQGEQGLPGIPGRDGIDGENGLPGKDGRDGKRGIDGKDGRNGIDGKDGKNGKDGTTVDIKEIVKELNKPTKGKMADLRWHGAGLSKVSTDATLTGTGTPSSPLSVVGGGGGIGAWNIPPETPLPDGSVTQFTVGALPPTDVLADGLIYPSGTVWTFLAGIITLDIGGAGPTQFIRYR